MKQWLLSVVCLCAIVAHAGFRDDLLLDHNYMAGGRLDEKDLLCGTAVLFVPATGICNSVEDWDKLKSFYQKNRKEGKLVVVIVNSTGFKKENLESWAKSNKCFLPIYKKVDSFPAYYSLFDGADQEVEKSDQLGTILTKIPDVLNKMPVPVYGTLLPTFEPKYYPELRAKLVVNGGIDRVMGQLSKECGGDSEKAKEAKKIFDTCLAWIEARNAKIKEAEAVCPTYALELMEELRRTSQRGFAPFAKKYNVMVKDQNIRKLRSMRVTFDDFYKRLEKNPADSSVIKKAEEQRSGIEFIKKNCKGNAAIIAEAESFELEIDDLRAMIEKAKNKRREERDAEKAQEKANARGNNN